jgi:transcriptional regulator with XRE-family HTH domain
VQNPRDRKLNFETLAGELIRALRARRSQTDLSRRLGYKSNILHRWERGECWPNMGTFYRMCAIQRVDLAASFATFYGRRPTWAQTKLNAYRDPSLAEGLSSVFLNDLRGKVSILHLSQTSGYSRFTLSRWLNGSAQPNLPGFLSLVESSSGRVLDYVATLTSPDNLPSVQPLWRRLEMARAVAYEKPWSHAVLRALEFVHHADELPSTLGLSKGEVELQLAALRDTGQVVRKGRRWIPTGVARVDTGRDPKRSRLLKAAWTKVALDRMEQGRDGLFGYSVFAVSRADLARMRALQLEYVRALDTIATQSAPSEVVALFCVQMLDLGAG